MILNDNVFIIAEAGVNHNGDLNLAFKLVDAAKKAGADSIKFQTFRTEKIMTKFANLANYQKKNTGSQSFQYEMIKKLELSYQEFIKLKEYCDITKIMFLSTPDDEDSLDFLVNELKIPIIKIGSGELTNLSFLKKIAAKNRPVIMSTGMSNLGEIEDALNTINIINPNIEIYVLHCTTNYPTSFDEVNLKAMVTIGRAFKIPVGYSDHTLGIEVPIAAVAMGAKIIEKHFTIDKSLSGPDHKASLEPGELKKMVEAIRNIEIALGNGIKKANKNEIKIMKVVRRSLIAARDIKKGETIKKSDIAIKRPEIGILPKYREIITGMKLLKSIKQDKPFQWENFK